MKTTTIVLASALDANWTEAAQARQLNRARTSRPEEEACLPCGLEFALDVSQFARGRMPERAAARVHETVQRLLENSVRGFVALAVAMLPLVSEAGEPQSFCDMTRSLADVKAAVLSSSAAFATVGPGEQVDTQSALVGVRKSISGAYQAGIVHDIAEAECEAYTAQAAVKIDLQYAEAQMDLRAQRLQVDGLRLAVQKAEENLAAERSQLMAHAGTWADVRAALDIRDKLRDSLVIAEESVAKLSTLPQVHQENLAAFLEKGLAAQAKTTYLRGHLDASSAWDFGVSLGGKKDFGPRTTSAFIGVSLSRSFGMSKAEESAQRASQQSAVYLREQQDGLWQVFEQRKVELRATLAAQDSLRRDFEERLALLDEARSQVSGVSTSAALRMARNLEAERLGLLANLSAISAKQAALSAWLDAQL